MAEDNGQETKQETENQPLQVAQQTTQEQHPQQQSQPQTNSQPPFIKELRDTLNALPERIAMAVTASFPQQTTAQPPTQTESKSSDTTTSHSASDGTSTKATKKETAEQQPPAKFNFGEWWFKG